MFSINSMVVYGIHTTLSLDVFNEFYGCLWHKYNTVTLCFQSPGSGSAFHNSAFENPNLLDNWDDAEGYYSMCFQDSRGK